MTEAEKILPADQDAPAVPADDSEKKQEGAAKSASTKSNAIWMGTAVGVGSAALVAALMYAKRRK